VHDDVDIRRFVPHTQSVAWLEDPRPHDRTWAAAARVEVGPHRAPDYDVWCSTAAVQALFAAKVRASRSMRTCVCWRGQGAGAELRPTPLGQSRLDPIPQDVFLGARRRANPYERIGKSIFINRAAVKMANLDQLCALLPREADAPYTFADACAGPGGFTGRIHMHRSTGSGRALTLLLRQSTSYGGSSSTTSRPMGLALH
jgi:hypothetical protein